MRVIPLFLGFLFLFSFLRCDNAKEIIIAKLRQTNRLKYFFSVRYRASHPGKWPRSGSDNKRVPTLRRVSLGVAGRKPTSLPGGAG